METMGRHIANDSISSLAEGIEVIRFLAKYRELGNVGSYSDWISDGSPSLTRGGKFITGIGALPNIRVRSMRCCT
jgi:hypothetical protein